MSAKRSRLILLSIAVLLPLAALVYRVETGAASAWSDGVYAESMGELEDAVYDYQRSAKWNTLFSSTSTSARTKLKQIATQAEAQGKVDLALLTQRYLRGSLLATNHLWRSDNDAEMAQINQTIARLTADIQMASGAVTIRGRTFPCTKCGPLGDTVSKCVAELGGHTRSHGSNTIVALDGHNDVQVLLKSCVEAGVVVHRITPNKRTLEEIFVEESTQEVAR